MLETALNSVVENTIWINVRVISYLGEPICVTVSTGDTFWQERKWPPIAIWEGVIAQRSSTYFFIQKDLRSSAKKESQASELGKASVWDPRARLLVSKGRTGPVVRLGGMQRHWFALQLQITATLVEKLHFKALKREDRSVSCKISSPSFFLTWICKMYVKFHLSSVSLSMNLLISIVNNLCKSRKETLLGTKTSVWNEQFMAMKLKSWVVVLSLFLTALFLALWPADLKMFHISKGNLERPTSQ